MNEKISRILLAIEALLLCLPLSALFIFKALPAAIYFLGDEIHEPTYITVTVNIAIISGVISAWWLMLNFIFRGHDALMGTSAIWWFISGAIGICTILAWIYANSIESYGPSSFLSFGWGILFLPSYIHLLLERRRNKALTNQPSPTH